MEPLIFKIVSRDAWNLAKQVGQFRGAAIDLEDGFIHFSTATQVQETAQKHFSGKTDLLLVAVETNRLGKELRWEPSRGGALFPHLYGMLDTADIAWEKPLPWDGERHVFPAALSQNEPD